MTAGQPEPVARVEDRSIPGPGGDLPIRIYWPAGEPPFPLLGYIELISIRRRGIVRLVVSRRREAWDFPVAGNFDVAPAVVFFEAGDMIFAEPSRPVGAERCQPSGQNKSLMNRIPDRIRVEAL